MGFRRVQWNMREYISDAGGLFRNGVNWKHGTEHGTRKYIETDEQGNVLRNRGTGHEKTEQNIELRKYITHLFSYVLLLNPLCLFMQLLNCFYIGTCFLMSRNCTKDCYNMPFIVSVSESIHIVSRSYGIGEPAVLFPYFAISSRY